MSAMALPLVGREPELRALERALQMVEAGRPCALGVSGEPGIGKSRLLGDLERRARDRGWLVLTGRAGELERDLRFALMGDALAPVVSGESAYPAAALEAGVLRELPAVLPAVGVLAEVEPAALSGERHRVARAVRALLERAAAERPLALLLDDVHWADPASGDVLALLLHRLPHGRVLLALATRAGRAAELEGLLAGGERNAS